MIQRWENLENNALLKKKILIYAFNYLTNKTVTVGDNGKGC